MWCCQGRWRLTQRCNEQGGKRQRRQPGTYRVESIPGVAYLLPISGDSCRRPGHHLLIDRVVAECKNSEHASKAQRGNQGQDKGAGSSGEPEEQNPCGDQAEDFGHTAYKSKPPVKGILHLHPVSGAQHLLTRNFQIMCQGKPEGQSGAQEAYKPKRFQQHVAITPSFGTKRSIWDAIPDASR